MDNFVLLFFYIRKTGEVFMASCEKQFVLLYWVRYAHFHWSIEQAIFHCMACLIQKLV